MRFFPYFLDAGTRVAPAAAFFSFLVLPLLAAATAGADTVKLKNGQVLRGKVFDRGAYIIVERDSDPKATTSTAMVSIRIERQEIQGIEIEGQSVRPPADLDVVVFVNGEELAGHVEIRDGGRQVVILGEGERGETVLDSRQVRTILYSERAKGEQQSGSAPIGSTVQKLLSDLKASDPAARKTALDSLQQLGVYALPYLESRKEAQDPEVREAIRKVIEVARLKTYMTRPLVERVPDLARRLVEGDEAGRLTALKEALVASPRDTVPILVYFAKGDPSPTLRAFVFAQLSLLDCTTELLDLLDSRDGSVRLAAAIALGDNGVLLGVPLLIEALKHPEAAVRKVAIQKLEAWTGQFLGFFPDAKPEERAPAVARWEQWWAKDGGATVQRSLRATVKRSLVTEEEKTEGLAHWTNAQLLWDKVAKSGVEGEPRKQQLQKVRFLLAKSLDRFPQNVNARIAVAVLDYTELDDAASAKKELDLVVHRYDEDAGDLSRLLAHFHLGRIAQAEKRWDEADGHFRLAVSLDPKNVDALRGAALLDYQRAILDDALDKEGRLKWLRESVKTLDSAIAAADQYDSELRDRAAQAADAIAISQPYRRGTFLESVDAVKAELKRTAADLRFLRGRSHAALHEDESAFADYSSALQLDPANPLYKNAVKLWQPPRK